MLKTKMTVLLVTVALLFLSACSSRQEGEIDENTVNIDQEMMEIVVPEGKTDRLPGSLRWESVELYAMGIDFYEEQTGGLGASRGEENTESASRPAEPAPPPQPAPEPDPVPDPEPAPDPAPDPDPGSGDPPQPGNGFPFPGDGNDDDGDDEDQDEPWWRMN